MVSCFGLRVLVSYRQERAGKHLVIDACDLGVCEACLYVDGVCTITEWVEQAASFFIRNESERSRPRTSSNETIFLETKSG